MDAPIVFHYFWVFKLAFIVLFAYSVYIAVVKERLKSKIHNVVALGLLLLVIISPIKIQVDTDSVHRAQESTQEALKVLPPRVTIDSYKKAVQSVIGINKDDLE